MAVASCLSAAMVGPARSADGNGCLAGFPRAFAVAAYQALVVKSGMRRAIATFAVGLVGLLFGFSVAEVVVRRWDAGREFITKDTVIGYRLTPQFTRVLTQFEAPDWKLVLKTNNLGLRRDTDTTTAKPPGTLRVLVLGDSQTEGIVENRFTYPSILEESLQTHAAGKVEVLNAGVSGYSPLLELLWLQEWGARLHPDVVVLAIYTGNDLGELTASEASFGGFGRPTRIATMARVNGAWAILRPGAPGRLGEVDAWLQAQSQAYALLRTRIEPPAVEQIEALGKAAQRCPGCLQALWQEWFAENRVDLYAETPLKLREVLARFRSSAENLEATPVVVVLPTKLDVEEETTTNDVQAAAGTLGLKTPPGEFTATAHQQILAAAEAEQIETLDALPLLKQQHRDSGRSFYWTPDWHLNPDGNRAVAEALKPRLEEVLRDASKETH